MPLVRAAPVASASPQRVIALDLDALRSAEPDLRRRAASTLGHHAARPEADHDILTALTRQVREEPDAGVREAIFAAISAIGGAAAAALLAPLLRLEDAGLRTGALETIKRLGGDAVAAIDAVLTDPNPDVRLFAVEVMRAWPAALATPRLAVLLARETNVNVIGMALDVAAVAADVALLPAVAACAARFEGDYFVAFAAGLARDALAARPTEARPAEARPRGSARATPGTKKPRKAGR